MDRLAIIGAGISGLTAAWSLRAHPIEISIFEKSRGYSGRAATRGKYGARYDHGANFIVPTSDAVRDILREKLPTEALTKIEKEIWSFDRSGTLHSPADGSETEMWTYARGISTLGKLLAREASAVTHTETRVESLRRDADGSWRLMDVDGTNHGPFDAVLLTPPAPQTSSLLRETVMGASADESSRLDDLAEAVSDATYHPQFSYIFGYDRAIRRHGDYHGLKNGDGKHDISWISFEHDKPERAADGMNIIVIQMSPRWTKPRVNSDPDEFVADVKEQAGKILDANLKRQSWYDTQRWRYSLPAQGADVERLAKGQKIGLYFAGDYVAGKGRVAAAMETGLDVGTTIGAEVTA